MLKRRNFVTAGFLGTVLSLAEKPVLAAAPAPSLIDAASKVDNVKSMSPEDIKEVVRTCIGMAFDDMNKHKQPYGGIQKGSLRCAVSNSGKSAEVHIGQSLQLSINLSLDDGREPEIGFVTPSVSGQVVPFNPGAMKSLTDVVQGALKAKQPATAPGWD